VETLPCRSIEEEKVMNIEAQEEEEMSWIKPIICYKTKG